MEDQTLNPFRAPTAPGQAPRPQPTVEAVIRRRPFGCAASCPSPWPWSAIIFVAYWGVWHFDFVYFDDPGYVTDNLDVKRGLPLVHGFQGLLREHLLGIHGLRAKQLAPADLAVAHARRAALRAERRRASRHQYHLPRVQHAAVVLAAARG